MDSGTQNPSENDMRMIFFNLLIYSANSNSYFFLLSSSVIFLNFAFGMLHVSQITQMSHVGVRKCTRVFVGAIGSARVCMGVCVG